MAAAQEKSAHPTGDEYKLFRSAIIGLAKTLPAVQTQVDMQSDGSLGLLGLANRKIIVTEAVFLEATNFQSVDAIRVSQWLTAATKAGVAR